MAEVIEWQSIGRENLRLELDTDGSSIQGVKMQAIGCLDFLKKSQEMKGQLSGSIADLPLPEGTDHSSLIWKEVILKIKGQWKLPVENEELCHCRKIPTLTVDEAIVYGAHNVVEIRKLTSANTGCGTCIPDVESLLKNRLGNG